MKDPLAKFNIMGSDYSNNSLHNLKYKETFIGNSINSQRTEIYFFFFLNKFIYLFLAALGLRCCTQAFSSCGEPGLLFVVVHGLLIAVASLVVEHGLQARGLSSCGSRALEHRLSSCGAQAQLLRGMWDLPGPGLELVCPALAGRFLTTAPPGKS